MTFPFTFCPRCGAPLAEGMAYGRERRICRFCGFVQFFDPKVAVGALVSDGERVLLVRRTARPGIGLWALPAGYMDSDEIPEEAVKREIAEETGLAVRVLRLADVVPLAGWEERRGILLLYIASPLSPLTSLQGQLVPADDVSEAKWFAPDEIPWGEIAFPSTTEFLNKWIKEKQEEKENRD